jgi:hypothetical protein
LYGDKEHYNYDTSISFDISSYPVARFVNEVSPLTGNLGWHLCTPLSIAADMVFLAFCSGYKVWLSFSTIYLHIRPYS